MLAELLSSVTLSFNLEQKKRLKEEREILEEDKVRIDKCTKAEYTYKGCIIKVRYSDFTKESVDAIVNPANEELNN